MITSGQEPYAFAYRDDLRRLPQASLACEVNLHGGFAKDEREGFAQLYYGMPNAGILRVDADLKTQELIRLPKALTPLNFHSTTLGEFDGKQRLFLAANNDAMVAVLSLEGELDFILPKPEFEAYQSAEAKFKPTDTLLLKDKLLVADGYGSNYISSADLKTQTWTDIWGGPTDSATENGKFTTAHGITKHPNHHVVIADRPYSRLQMHHSEGAFVASFSLPKGAWPCGIDYVFHNEKWLAVIGSLKDPIEGAPAPIYILDGESHEVLSIIRPKEDLGLERVQHLHNVVWHIHQNQLYLVCQAWNPGFYFVLERI